MTHPTADRSAEADPFPVERITDFILSELRAFQRDALIAPEAALGAETRLIGPQAVLKSRTMLELLLAVEDHLDEVYGQTFDWSSDNALSLERSPWRSVRTLAEHAAAAAAGGGR
ncbi:MAG: hypothetical protein HXY25_10045 [Alphaproteobacteria bacterium]|nr:hypothetical protein [Alphaproteobacteria bacterium]